MNFLIVIGGPTAAGKTSLAISLAREFKTEIISADSRQFYREMTIGTAKPSMEELCAVPHHFINSLSINDTYDIARFEKDTLQLLREKFEEHRVMIMVGGSGLYHEAVVQGLDDLPPKNEAIRLALQQELATQGLSRLQEELIRHDPETAQRIDLQNPLRVLRALEICRITGKPYSSFLGKKNETRNFKSLLITVAPDRKLLYERINHRVDQMVSDGLVEEVKSLLPFRHLNALRTVGYTELFEYFDGNCSLDVAIEKIKQHTRNYAKRQLTWFRNRSDYTLFDPNDTEKIKSFISTAISQ